MICRNTHHNLVRQSLLCQILYFISLLKTSSLFKSSSQNIATKEKILMKKIWKINIFIWSVVSIFATKFFAKCKVYVTWVYLHRCNIVPQLEIGTNEYMYKLNCLLHIQKVFCVKKTISFFFAGPYQTKQSKITYLHRGLVVVGQVFFSLSIKCPSRKYGLIPSYQYVHIYRYEM